MATPSGKNGANPGDLAGVKGRRSIRSAEAMASRWDAALQRAAEPSHQRSNSATGRAVQAWDAAVQKVRGQRTVGPLRTAHPRERRS